MARKKIVGIGAVVIVLLVAGAVVWLFLSGHLVWSNGQGQVAAKAVCGDDIVSTYNNAATPLGRKGSSDLTIDQDGLKSLASTIKTKNNYQNDATCQTLLFWIAILTNDYKAAPAPAAAVQRLHDDGFYANSNIYANQPVSAYPRMIMSITPNGKQGFGG